MALFAKNTGKIFHHPCLKYRRIALHRYVKNSIYIFKAKLTKSRLLCSLKEYNDTVYIYFVLQIQSYIIIHISYTLNVALLI